MENKCYLRKFINVFLKNDTNIIVRDKTNTILFSGSCKNVNDNLLNSEVYDFYYDKYENLTFIVIIVKEN